MRPLDPSVHPGAPDRPDLAFTDTNCDGIDGDKANAVFVSSTAPNDDGSGTLANPKKLITSAIALAAADGKDVYVTGGNFPGTLALADGVSVYGGYTPDFANRSAAETTNVNGINGPGALAVRRHRRRAPAAHPERPAGARTATATASAPSRTAPWPPRWCWRTSHSTTAPGIDGASGGTGPSGQPGLGFSGGFGGFGGCGDGVAGLFGNPGIGNGQHGRIRRERCQRHVRRAGGRDLAPAAVQQRPVREPGRRRHGRTRRLRRHQHLQRPLWWPGRPGWAGRVPRRWVAPEGTPVAVRSASTRSTPPSWRWTPPLRAVTVATVGTAEPAETVGRAFPVSSGLPVSASPSSSRFALAMAQQGTPGGVRAAAAAAAAAVSAGRAPASTKVARTRATPIRRPRSHSGTRRPRRASRATRFFAPTAEWLSRSSVRPRRRPRRRTTSTVTVSLDPADACPADAGGTNGCPGPETTIVSGPADGSYLLSQATSMGLSSTAAGSTFACSLDGGDADTCTSPHALSGLSARTHVVKAWATDGFGSADPSAASRTFTVPVNNTALTHSAGWTKKTGTGYFRDTYSTSTKQGAALSTAGDAARGGSRWWRRRLPARARSTSCWGRRCSSR